MLVLSRKKNEQIIIGPDIVLVVVEIRGDKVRLGIEAPKELPVHRKEVYEAIQRGGGVDRKRPQPGNGEPGEPGDSDSSDSTDKPSEAA